MGDIKYILFLVGRITFELIWKNIIDTQSIADFNISFDVLNFFKKSVLISGQIGIDLHITCYCHTISNS